MNNTVSDNTELPRTRLLVVDDDSLVLATLSMGLREEGYEIFEASSASEAIELAARYQPELALLDIRMPGQSGIELANTLYRRWKIPFLFLTAFNDKETVDEAIAEGAMGYLVKPIDINKIVPTIETALYRGRERHQLQQKEHDLSRALHTGRETSIAIGVIMSHTTLDQEQAEQALRAFARKHRVRMRDVALRVLEAAENLNGVIRDITH
jgi:response regulator NasT